MIRPETQDMDQYLQHTEIINWRHPTIIACSEKISAQGTDQLQYTKNCFEFVRDRINHSRDFQTRVVTCSASEVLEQQSGYCYAKSHLLAALLRVRQIPAGFCYQRLSLAGNGPPYSLHGLNAVYLEKYGWYRLDARGNREDVHARFTPPVEQLAFQVQEVQEFDLPEIWCEPLPIIVKTLQRFQSVDEVYQNLPDLEKTPPGPEQKIINLQ